MRKLLLSKLSKWTNEQMNNNDDLEFFILYKTVTNISKFVNIDENFFNYCNFSLANL